MYRYKLLLGCWFLILLPFLFTENFRELWMNGIIQFSFTLQPRFSTFFNTYSLTGASDLFLLQKLGHYLAFFTLAVLSILAWKEARYGFLFSFCFAIISEFFQPFFERDGRFLDVIINSIGILTCLLIYYIVKNKSVYVNHLHKPIRRTLC
ncbi:VanZ family protein [Halalkalibacter kiskunsagensis]|uniref:VanZ family protein n=1 Tax=Halalkalibacter kiskunsagensis TaxID=1548599 RepID=A0ABV6K9M2_9BACI